MRKKTYTGWTVDSPPPPEYEGKPKDIPLDVWRQAQRELEREKKQAIAAMHKTAKQLLKMAKKEAKELAKARRREAVNRAKNIIRGEDE
tara:strand:- start:542 stop:808 length:267 start_codon:yes stop_codon:yes gene_type:complete